jgi:F-type H+-transporting ATPase subunit epsilon
MNTDETRIRTKPEAQASEVFSSVFYPCSIRVHPWLIAFWRSSMATRELKCVVVTPERALVEADADFVALPLYDGEVGVLPGRAPLVGRLGAGELRIKRGNQTQHFYVDGGFVQVRDNVVSVLTSRAMPANEIQPASARQALENAQAAQKRAAGTEAQEVQLAAQQKARVQLRIAAQHGGSAT